MKKVYLIIIMLLLLTLSGCNFISGIILQDKLTKHLNEKYDKEFEITKLVKEFDGNHGWHYRAVFHEKDSQEKSVLYCYKDDLDEGTIIRINGIKHAVVDDYANTIFQEEYAERIQKEIGEIALVKCFFAETYDIDEEMLDKGLTAFLNNPNIYHYFAVFVLMDIEDKDVGIREKVEEYMSRYNPESQYLYIGYFENFDVNLCNQLYYDENNDFDHYLVHDSEAKFVELSVFSRNEGFVNYEILKE